MKYEEAIFSLVAVVFGVLLIWSLVQNKAIIELQLDMISCDGISHFYRAEGLVKDSSTIPDVVTYRSTLFPQSPEDYYKNGGDCKSHAKVVMCLCELYRTDCYYYYNVNPFAHVGVIYNATQFEKITAQYILLS